MPRSNPLLSSNDGSCRDDGLSDGCVCVLAHQSSVECRDDCCKQGDVTSFRRPFAR